MPDNKTTSKNRNKLFQKTTDALLSPFAIGIYVTICFVLFAKIFYDVRSRNEDGQRTSGFTGRVFQIVQGLDFMLSDARLATRGVLEKENPQVALLAVDDESIKIMGRWPWPRERMAKIIDETYKNGAKAIGLDIIWSEPQENPKLTFLQSFESQIKNPTPEITSLIKNEKSALTEDQILKSSIETHKDKLVMGVFPTDENRKELRPYTDYCRNEAFNRVNGDMFVKIDNFTFLVEDKADRFETLKFNEVFGSIFDGIKNTTIVQMMRDVIHKDSPENLTLEEKNKVFAEIERRYMDYCNRWLTPPSDDPASGSKDDLSDWLTFVKFFENLTSDKEETRLLSATSPITDFVGLTPEAAIEKFKSSVLSHPVPQYESWTINLPEFHEVATYSGAFMADQDEDGKIRKNPLFYRTGNRVGSSFIPSIALQTFLIANPGYQAVVEIDLDPQTPTQKVIRSFKIIDINKDEAEQFVTEIPVDGQGRLKINYAGPGLTYPYIPAKELLTPGEFMNIKQRTTDPKTGQVGIAEKRVKKSEFLAGKSLIFGATAMGVYDLRVTPFDKNFPGPETHLTVLDNLLTQKFIRTPVAESKWMLWILAGLGILLSAAVAFSGPFLGFFMVLFAEGFLIWMDQVLLRKGIVSTSVLPALLFLSIYILMTLYKYFTEERKKKQLRSTFSKYVSPAIVDEILEDPENIELGGRKERMSVFFSDVRGFTTISEKLDPQVLSDVLNQYLTPMTQIVFNNKGTLDKYMGDALMAFFGAPIGYTDHAKYACRCALQSIAKLKEIQVEFAQKGLPSIDIGIGINTSEMSVGNMGSEIVRNYTVMGDGVNLGSRLEGINKEYGTRIIISQFTQADLGNSFTCREVDWVRVKGKQEPVRIFELISEGAPPQEMAECLRHFADGFALYHERKFAPAKQKFELALQASPMDNPTKLYIERCDEYLAEAPPTDWDGVYVMKTK